MGLFDFSDNSDIRQQERAAASRNRVAANVRLAIDRALDSRLTPDFFDSIARAYARMQGLQLQRERQRAREDAIRRLAMRGLLNSSMAARVLGQIDYRNSLLRQAIAQQARAQADAARRQAENVRMSLYDMAEAGMSAADAAMRARHLASTINPQPVSLLAGAFADIVNFGARGLQAQAVGLPGFNPLAQAFRGGFREIK